MADDFVNEAARRVLPLGHAMLDRLEDDGADPRVVVPAGLIAAYNEGMKAAASELLAQLIEAGHEVAPFERPWPDSMQCFLDVLERYGGQS